MGASDDFRELCRRSDLDGVEKQIALWARKLQTPTEKQWTDVENSLLHLHLDFATLEKDGLFSSDGKEDLAATLLARATGNSHRAQAGFSTHALATLAALSFASAGNFPTASVYARQALDKNDGAGPFEKWVLQTLASRVRQHQADLLPGLVSYSKSLKKYFARGIEGDFNQATDALLGFYGHEGKGLPDFDQYLFMFWELTHSRFGELCAAQCLNDAGFNNPAYVAALGRDTSPLLFPTQVKALKEHGLLDGDSNSIVLLPTSTGKSLLGELAILSALSEERPIGVYLAPYRALADQLYRRMKDRLEGIGVRCEMRRGGYLESELSLESGEKTVLVSTPEAFDGLLRSSPHLLSRLSCCVFDEFHLIEQGARGIRYEGLVARLLSAEEGNRARVVALSPVLTLAENLTAWLGVDSGGVVRSDWRPTGRRLAIAGPDRKIHYYTPGERLRDEASPSVAPDWSGATVFPNQIESAPDSVYGHVQKEHAGKVLDNAVSVALEQYERLNAPVLVVASTRAGSRHLASKISKGLPQLSPEHPLIELAQQIEAQYPHLYTLRECMLRGVVYHNAALPNWVREQIERAIEEQSCRIVASTTTLAEGVDLPFRVVVLANWQQFRYGSSSPLPTLLFRNIAGRCGRAGVFAEGDTVIVDSPTKEPANLYSHRRQEYYRLYIKPADIQLESSLVRALSSGVDAVQAQALEELLPVVESHFVAQLHTFAPEENQEEIFVSSFLAAQTRDARRKLKSIVDELIGDMLSVSDHPLLVRNSPLALTDLGQVVVQTGLSPRSGLELARLISSYSSVPEPRVGRALRKRYGIQWEPLLSSLAEGLVGKTLRMKELASDAFLQVGRRGYPVNEGNFQDVLMAWVSGLPIPRIAFITLRKKELKSLVGSWLDGGTGGPPQEFEEDLEQVSAFCGSYLGEQWGWILRAGQSIASHLENEELYGVFSQLAVRIEFGVRHAASAMLLRQKCPIERAKVDVLVGAYISDVAPEIFVPAEFAAWLLALLEREPPFEFRTTDSEVSEFDVSALASVALRF